MSALHPTAPLVMLKSEGMKDRLQPAPFPFFVGCGRSGTTLIRTIFNEHPSLAIPRESHFIPILGAERRRYESPGGVDSKRLLAALQADERYRRWKLPSKQAHRAAAEAADLPDAIRRLYSVYARRHGKPRYADKTPNYATHIPLLANLFPEARFVHVIRDGRNVALSLLERSFGPDTFDHAMLYWRHRVTTARAAGARLGPDRYLEYRHEDLVSDPEGTVRDICGFLDLDFVPEMLRYHQGRQPRSVWHRHLDKPPTPALRDFNDHLGPADMRVAELLAGDLLTDLGYYIEPVELSEHENRRAKRRAAVARRRQRGSLALDRLRWTRAVRACRRIRALRP